MLPVPGPTSNTTSVGARAAYMVTIHHTLQHGFTCNNNNNNHFNVIYLAGNCKKKFIH